MLHISINSFFVFSYYLLIWLFVSLNLDIYILHFINYFPIPYFNNAFNLITVLNILFLKKIYLEKLVFMKAIFINPQNIQFVSLIVF